jgi:hypothetical protein
MHFWIDIEFTKILGQFKPIKFIDLFMIYNSNFFNLLDSIFVPYNFFFEYNID